MRMSEGEKLMVVCPSNKAYGPNGAGKIPPYTDIAFEMELLKINNPKSNDQYKMFDPKYKNDKWLNSNVNINICEKYYQDSK